MAVASDAKQLADAASFGNLKKVKSLLKKKTSIKWKDKDGCDALYQIASFSPSAYEDVTESEVEAITTLLIEAGANPNSTYKFLSGMPAIVIAGMSGNPGAVKALAKAGADVNISDESKYNALHRAALGGWHETVEALLELGADKTKKTGHKQTAKDLAKEGLKEDSGLQLTGKDYKKTLSLLK